MKKNGFIVLASFAFLALSCKKKNIEPLYGEISSLQFDGKSFEKPGMKLYVLAYDGTQRCKIPQYRIQFILRAANDSLIEQISMRNLPMAKTGIIHFRKSVESCDTIPDVLFSLNQGGDMTVADFSTLPKYDNYINIKSFDEKTKEVKGNFKLTLRVNDYPTYHRHWYRDTIAFESGDFSVRLQ
jgi:hypothetical protein